MKLKIFSIYDEAAQAYTKPFFMHNQGLAIRAFTDNVNSPEPNNISEHPEQFTLFELGEFDDTNGTIQSHESPSAIVKGNELKENSYAQETVKQMLSEILNKLEAK